MHMISRRLLYYSIIDLFLVLLVVAIRAIHPGTPAQAMAFMFLMVWLAALAGAHLLPRRRPLAQFVAGMTAVGALMMALGAGIYWLYRLTFLEAFGIVLATTAIITIVCRNTPLPAWRSHSRRLAMQLVAHKWFLLLPTIAAGIAVALLAHLRLNGVMDAIRTPWLFIDEPLFFGGIGAAGVLLWFAAWKQTPTLRPLHLMLFMLVFTSVGLLIFQTGYGFDPFVHRATEMHILQNGVITPKPLWYVGQHALVVMVTHFTGLSLMAIDKLLLPAGAAFLVVGWLYVIAPESWTRRVLLLLLLPFITWFTATTPQGIGNLLYLILMLELLMVARKKLGWALPALTIAAIATLHPMATVPALILTVFTILVIRGARLRIAAPAALMTALLMPALFFVNEWQKTHAIPSLGELAARAASRFAIDVDALPLQNSFYALPNVTYTLRILIWLFALGCVAYGIAVLRNRAFMRPYLWTAGILAVSTALAHFLTALPDVISYEQFDYSLRMLWMMGFTLLPFFWYGGLAAINRLQRTHWSVQGLLVITLTAGLTANLYLLYPRVDRMVNHRGYSTGAADLIAAEFIDFQNPNGNYAVLANQSVAAGALRQLGFKYEFRTKDGPVYFYPVPTGGPLYQYYLDMIDKGPTTDIAKAALEYTGAERVYFVLNDYWWRDYRIANEAKKYADWWTDIAGGAIHIFAWQRNRDMGWLTVEQFTKE